MPSLATWQPVLSPGRMPRLCCSDVLPHRLAINSCYPLLSACVVFMSTLNQGAHGVLARRDTKDAGRRAAGPVRLPAADRAVTTSLERRPGCKKIRKNTRWVLSKKSDMDFGADDPRRYTMAPESGPKDIVLPRLRERRERRERREGGGQNSYTMIELLSSRRGF